MVVAGKMIGHVLVVAMSIFLSGQHVICVIALNPGHLIRIQWHVWHAPTSGDRYGLGLPMGPGTMDMSKMWQYQPLYQNSMQHEKVQHTKAWWRWHVWHVPAGGLPMGLGTMVPRLGFFFFPDDKSQNCMQHEKVQHTQSLERRFQVLTFI